MHFLYISVRADGLTMIGMGTCARDRVEGSQECPSDCSDILNLQCLAILLERSDNYITMHRLARWQMEEC